MPMMKRGVGSFAKQRVLISGLSNTGKTHSIATFAEEGQSLVILSCPGETGTHSLPEDSDTIQSYYFENVSEKDRRSVEWARETLVEFDALYLEVEKNAPDKLFIDGAHNLYDLAFNIITGGLFFAGSDLKQGNNTYAAAAFYNRAHVAFGNRLKRYYDSKVPFIGVTTWERLMGARVGDEGGSGNTVTISDERYWWPAIPGDMATKVVGFFDARISARLEKRCIHTTCEASQDNQLHYVWQFYPKNDVAGVGIKGLKITKAMQQAPWIHQDWAALQALLRRAYEVRA
jgi:hypothetical protein